MRDRDKNNQKDVVSRIENYLKIAGGGIIVFYGVGFIIVRCFVSSANIDGIFWFSRNYYEEAGAKFFVGMLDSLLMNPLVFFIYLALLLFLMPKPENIINFQFKLKQNKKLIVLLLITALTYVFAIKFEWLTNYFIDNFKILFSIYNAIGLFSQELNWNDKKELIFFTFTIPVSITLSLFLYNHSKHITNKILYYVTICLYFLFLAILPISYGHHIFDIKAILVNSPTDMYKNAGLDDNDQFPGPSTMMWFLGKYEGNYLFARLDGLASHHGEGSGAETHIINRTVDIESHSEKKILFIDFSPEEVQTVKSIIGAASTSNQLGVSLPLHATEVTAMPETTPAQEKLLYLDQLSKKIIQQ